MLTDEAMEERAWCGLSILRQILADKRRDFENGHYLTSVSDAEFDHYRRYALLGALVVEHRDLLAKALVAEAASTAGGDRLRAASGELDQLAGVLHSLATRLDSVAGDVRSVQEQVWRASEGR